MSSTSLFLSDNMYESIEDNIEPVLFRRQLEQMKRTDEAGLRRILADRIRPPLNLAARLGRKELVEILLEFGADRRTRDLHNSLAVHTAAVYDQVEVLKILLKNDEDAIKELDEEGGWTPLLCALFETSENSVTYILENHKPECFSWNRTSSDFGLETHPMCFAATWSFNKNSKGKEYSNGEVIRLLLQNGCPNEYNGEHLVIHVARAGPGTFNSEEVVDILKNLVGYSDASKSDLHKAKQQVEKRLSEISDEDIKRHLEQVHSYLTDIGV